MRFQDPYMAQFCVIPNTNLSLNMKLFMFKCCGVEDDRPADEDNSLFNLEN